MCVAVCARDSVYGGMRVWRVCVRMCVEECCAWREGDMSVCVGRWSGRGRGEGKRPKGKREYNKGREIQKRRMGFSKRGREKRRVKTRRNQER